MSETPIGNGPGEDPSEVLRTLAEATVDARGGMIPHADVDDVRRRLHELEVHQVELEMQNEELRVVQRELELWQERYLDLYDQAPIGFIMLDEQGIVLEANLTVATLLGVPRDDLIGAPLTGLVARDDQDLLYLHWRRLFTERTAQNFDVRLATAAVEPVWVAVRATPSTDVAGHVVARAWLVDGSRRRKAETALAASRTLMRSIVDATPDAIYAKDPSGRYLLFSTGAGAISGMSEAEVLGRDDTELFPSEMAAIAMAGEGSALQAAMPVTCEETVSDAAGARRTFLTTRGPLRDAEGRVVGLFGVGRDITERKIAEDEISRLNADLERRVEERTARLAAANEELETFSYSVSHDLRSPLRAMTGFAELLSRHAADTLDPKGRHYLDNIVEGGQRMGALIEELLAYSRLGRGHVRAESVPLEPILATLRTTLATRIRACHGTLVVAGSLAVPLGDPTLLEEVLLNLLDNAFTYRRPDVAPVVTVTAVPMGARVILSVADNGIGIPDEFQERILEPFVRLHTSDEYPGTGIGLATVRKAAWLMDSEVHVESGVGIGSTFSLDLPAAAAVPG
jgi:PAS domain S-box-containing protein